jgi:hypothetical protein
MTDNTIPLFSFNACAVLPILACTPGAKQQFKPQTAPFRSEGAEAEAGAGAMLVAYRLAGLSALETDYADLNALPQQAHAARRTPFRRYHPRRPGAEPGRAALIQRMSVRIVVLTYYGG